MTRQAAATCEIRCKQSSTDLNALSILTDAAKALDVFGGKVDTRTSARIGKKLACMPDFFRTVDALRLDGPTSPYRLLASMESEVITELNAESLTLSEKWIRQRLYSMRQRHPLTATLIFKHGWQLSGYFLMLQSLLNYSGTEGLLNQHPKQHRLPKIGQRQI